jgi:hypothetical protein
LRVKSVLNVDAKEGPVLVYGVQQVLHPPVALRQRPDGDRRSRLVLIVRDLDQKTIAEGWRYLAAKAAGVWSRSSSRSRTAGGGRAGTDEVGSRRPIWGLKAKKSRFV